MLLRKQDTVFNFSGEFFSQISKKTENIIRTAIACLLYRLVRVKNS